MSKKNTNTEKKAKPDISIEIRKSDNYISDVATDVAVSGPFADGFLQLSFFVERIEMLSQSGFKKEGVKDGYELRFLEGDTSHHRELRAEISVSEAGIKNLIRNIGDRYNLDLVERQSVDSDE